MSRVEPVLMLLCISLTIVVATPADTNAAPASGSATEETPESLAQLRQILQVGLRAQRPVEFTFINNVVQSVGTGQLPRKMVESAFQWVRTRKKYERRKVVYFEGVLRKLAEQEGLSIPGPSTF